MEIIPCGTLVNTIIGNVEGQITASCIRFDSIEYELSYIYCGEFKTIWVREEQLNKIEIVKQKIGFK